MSDKPRSFVIMPFADEFDEIFTNIIKPALEEAGYLVTRADSFSDQKNILSDIVSGIATAHLVVADLTQNNPNVFYELGICHALRIPTIMLAQEMNEVPFDLRSYRIFIYETHFNRINKLRSMLKDVAEKHLNGEIEFSNPVIDFSSLTSEVSIVEETPVIIDPISSIAESDAEKGFLDFLMETESAGEALQEASLNLTHYMEEQSEEIRQYNDQINLLSQKQPVKTSEVYKISQLTASTMNNFSKRVEELLPQFETNVNKLDENYSGFIIHGGLIDDENTENVDRIEKGVRELLEVALSVKDSLEGMRKSILDLVGKNISREVNRAGHREADVIKRLITEMEKIDAFSERVIKMLADK